MTKADTITHITIKLTHSSEKETIITKEVAGDLPANANIFEITPYIVLYSDPETHDTHSVYLKPTIKVFPYE